MSMNIKSKETHRRAKELARLAGETMAEAVNKAVDERLERIRKGGASSNRVGRSYRRPPSG